MKRLLTLFIVLGLVACGTGVATAQEVLSNGNFNAVDPAGTQQLLPTGTDWIYKAERGTNLAFDDGISTEPPFNQPMPIDGENGNFFKAFIGVPPWDPTLGLVDAHVHQDNPGTPGMKYILTGWFGAGQNYSGLLTGHPTGDTRSEFALEFLNGGGTVIGGSVLDLKPGLIAAQSNPGDWHYAQYMVMATAPPLTAQVRVRASMFDGFFTMDPNQAMVADNFSLVCIPEPASVMLGVIGVLGLVGLVRRR